MRNLRKRKWGLRIEVKAVATLDSTTFSIVALPIFLKKKQIIKRGQQREIVEYFCRKRVIRRRE